MLTLRSCDFIGKLCTSDAEFVDSRVCYVRLKCFYLFVSKQLVHLTVVHIHTLRNQSEAEKLQFVTDSIILFCATITIYTHVCAKKSFLHRLLIHSNSFALTLLLKTKVVKKGVLTGRNRLSRPKPRLISFLNNRIWM